MTTNEITHTAGLLSAIQEAFHVTRVFSVKDQRTICSTWARGGTEQRRGISEERMEADARRLAACWNACDGISTEAIEEIATQGGFTKVVESTATHAKRIGQISAAGLLRRCEEFIAGFEGDDMQDDPPDALLVDLRAALDGAPMVSPKTANADPLMTAEALRHVCEVEGWGIYNGTEIQHDDEAGKFDQDDDAQTYVRRMAAAGSPIHAYALDRIGASVIVAAIDDDTGRPIVRPRHMIVGGNAYWAESLPGGLSFLMGAAVKVGGAVDWDSDYEVEHTACPNYDAILRDLTIG